MGGFCNIRGRDEQCMKLLCEDFQGRGHLEDLSIREKVTLKCFKYQDV